MTSPFAQVAPSLIAHGYSPIPIGVGTKYPARYEPAASEDGREWWPLKNWHVFCQRQAHPAIITQWSMWPHASIGLACGFGGLVAVDIDDNSLIEPLLAVLPPVLVGKRGRKGLTAFYRAAEPLPSKNYRAADKRGLLDFLSGGKQTVIPPSVHSDTGRPYEWTTARTLLDTPLADLPAITSANVAVMEEVLRDFGWDAPERIQAHGEAVARPARSRGAEAGEDELNIAATASRAQWLPLLGLHGLHRVSDGWRAVASFRASGSGKTGKRSLSLSIRDGGGIVDHGTGIGYNNVTFVAACLCISNAEAYAWLCDKLGLHDAPLINLRNRAPAVAVEPSYPDLRCSLAEAELAVQSLVGDKFEQSILDWRAVRNRIVLKPLLALRPQPVMVARIETGIGKTRATVEAVANMARRRLRVVYTVQRHDLADEVAAQFMAHSIKAEVYRGYDRPDPLAPGHAMCRNLPAYEAARDMGVGIRQAVCERRIEERIVRCRFADVCGRERQREATPQVWIVPAALLPLERPDFVFGGADESIDTLVIDERFHDGAIGEPQDIAVGSLARIEIEGCDPDESTFLAGMRRRLIAAVEANGDGPLSRTALAAQGIWPDRALRASYLEQRVCTSKLLRPGMSPAELKTVAYRHGQRTRLGRAAGVLWEQIALFLAFDFQQSGRLTVLGDKITARPLRGLHPSWQAPTLVLDATAPAANILASAIFGDTDAGGPPEITFIDIAAHWPDHVHVRQVVGAPVTMSKLGLWQTPKPQNEADVLRFVRLRASLAAPATIGLITYKGVLEKITGKLPPNVIARHFGALSGMNNMAGVAGLIVIGRPSPRRAAVEADASVLAGYPVSGGGDHYFEKVAGGIRRPDGGAVATTADRHPDALAESLRWQVTEAELLQAVGRLRPHRRAAACWVDIVCDTPLPLWVHEVVGWSKPSAVGDMAALGVVLINSRDAMKAYGFSKHDAEKVGGCPEIPNRILFRKNGATSPVRKFGYRKSGAGQKNNEGYFLPHVLKGGEASLREWLEEKLGPLASLSVEHSPATTTLGKIGRDAVDFASKLVQAPNGDGIHES